MKANVLLISNGSADSNGVIADAAAQTGRGLRHVKSSGEAFARLRSGLTDTDVVIIDLDPGIHGIAILEAIGNCEGVPPVIVVTGLEEADMTLVAYRHGAAACIGKPLSAAELASVIEGVCSGLSCDLWGHPRAARK